MALLVAPLAAISLLAAAAAVAINPVLINVQFTGRRKKRSSDNADQEWDPKMQAKMHELEVSNQKLSKQLLEYHDLRINHFLLLSSRQHCKTVFFRVIS